MELRRSRGKTFTAYNYMRRNDNPAATADGALDKFPADTRQKILEAKERLAALTSTDKIYGGKDGQHYTAERLALHDKILYEGVEGFDAKTGGTKFYEPILGRAAIARARPSDGGRPSFKILGGRGGSGKSAFGKRGSEAQVYDESNSLLLNSDDIKNMLPEMQGFNANQVHEESSFILDRAMKEAREQRVNVVLDGTIKSLQQSLDYVSFYRRDGYSIEAHYMYLPREIATERAIQRFLGSTGRLVPPEVILSNINNEFNFDVLKELADDWSFRDNNVARGEQPILVARKEF